MPISAPVKLAWSTAKLLIKADHTEKDKVDPAAININSISGRRHAGLRSAAEFSRMIIKRVTS